MTFYIPEYKVAPLFGKLEKLNRKCKKLNLPPITYAETGKEEFRKIDLVASNGSDLGQKTVLFREVDVVGEEPKLPGSYEFLAAIEHIEEGNIVSARPDNAFDLSKYRGCAANCDHCGHKRSRHKTYILININGEKQVGSTCIKDFLGGNGDPEAMLDAASALWEVIKEAQEDFEGGGGGKSYLELSRFLGCVVQCVKESGFTSRKQANERMSQSTGDFAANLYYSKDSDWQLDPKNTELAATYLEKGRMALEALADRNDFEHNLYVVTKREYLDLKHLGIAAYFIEWLNRKDREETERKAVCNEHFGIVGGKVELNLKFAGSNSFDSSYGVCHIIRFLDESGRMFTWKTGAAGSHIINCDKGSTLRIKGSIKQHTEYKDRKQTELTRCKILD